MLKQKNQHVLYIFDLQISKYFFFDGRYVLRSTDNILKALFSIPIQPHVFHWMYTFINHAKCIYIAQKGEVQKCLPKEQSKYNIIQSAVTITKHYGHKTTLNLLDLESLKKQVSFKFTLKSID